MNKSFFPLLLVSLFLFACPDKDPLIDSEIVVYNNSTIEIACFSQFKFPSDTFISNLVYSTAPDYFVIYSNDSLNFPGSWIQSLEEPNGKVLMFYLFNRDTIEQVSWERIEAENLIEKRYDLTLEKLDSLNWTITYP